MYRAFNLKFDLPLEENESFLEEGEKLKMKSEAWLDETLTPYLKKGGKLDAGKIQDTWFPAVGADVFISHSHDDLQTALIIAGYLKSKGVKAFIDSAAWGYAPNLLKVIDEHGSKNGPNNYDYHLRNATTSHVYMMLATSLARMIDSAEAVFFLNSPNSITSQEASNSTKSPWIFFELTALSWIRPRDPDAHRMVKLAKEESEGKLLNFSFDFDYKVELRNLTNLTVDDINQWGTRVVDEEPEYPLDLLYEDHPAPKTSLLNERTEN